MNELALFAGAGGGILGGHLLGWRTVCAVEWEPYAASVLAARQNDGLLPPFPIWDDVQTFDGRPWRGCVDVVSGGFPCQDISVAGKGAGIDGARSGMWGHMARIVGEVRPRYVFVENSPALLTRGLGRVLGDLAALGYDCRWTVLGAADVGAPHQRDRFWLVGADSDRVRLDRKWNSEERQQPRSRRQAWGELASLCGEVANADSISDAMRGHAANHAQEVAGGRTESGGSQCNSRQGCPQGAGQGARDVANTRKVGFPGAQTKQGLEWGLGLAISSLASGWWDGEPGETPRTVERGLGGVAHGVAARVDRLKAIGNGQVPLCAATAFKLLTETE
jgi:DNA (cytosine-5)-methyltransferase 1